VQVNHKHINTVH